MSYEPPKVVILVDLEGTLCDNRHRVDMFMAQEYEQYEDACGKDLPYPDVVAVLKSFCEDNTWIVPIIVTGRSEKYENTTIEWLADHVPIDTLALYMRPEFDIPSTKEAELKLTMLANIKQDFMLPEGTVFIALEDKDEVVEAYRNAGVFCWQVRNGVIS